MQIKKKKYFGQHFLKNEKISKNIVNSLSLKNCSNIVEIGPGEGALTKFLIKKNIEIKLIEIDLDCVKILKEKFQEIEVFHEDFLKFNLTSLGFHKYCIVGNFPYNISNQILFKILDNRDNVFEVVGMFQKEVADRICSLPKSKKYGILSVLIQAYFNCEQLFDVPSDNFDPKPKVNSSVIRLNRNNNRQLSCNHNLFVKIVKLGFSQRRKKLKNALKKIITLKNLNLDLLNKRAEELNVFEFVELTNKVFPNSSK